MSSEPSLFFFLPDYVIMVTTSMNEDNVNNVNAGSVTTANTMATSKATREKKKKGLSLSSLKSPFRLLGKTYCKGCHKKCSGEVLRVNDLYFHNGCFNCKGCGCSLSQGGFFSKDKEYCLTTSKPVGRRARHWAKR